MEMDSTSYVSPDVIEPHQNVKSDKIKLFNRLSKTILNCVFQNVKLSATHEPSFVTGKCCDGSFFANPRNRQHTYTKIELSLV